VNDELKKRLLADLERSGIQTELEVRRIFSERGWSVGGAGAYLDLDEGKSREIDASAYRVRNLKAHGKYCVYSEFHIIAEVKKSERPWVVLRRDLSKWSNSCAWNNLIDAVNLPCEPPRLVKSLEHHSLLRVNGWEGSGIHEAFKNPDQPTRWYSAFTSVLKASSGYLDEYATQGEKTTNDIVDNPTEFRFVQPLVVLDGILVTAELAEGEVRLQEVQSAAFRFEYKTAHYTKGRYRVDLVTLQGLAAYLDLVSARQDRFNEGIAANVDFPLEK
jgi:hypothetical protein